MDPETMEVIRKLAYLVDTIFRGMAILGIVFVIVGIVAAIKGATREVQNMGFKLTLLAAIVATVGYIYVIA